MKEKVDWIFHYVSNNAVCDICGKQESSFPQYICDAHTHGMSKYGHLEFQVVIDYGAEEVGRLLNEMGRRVQSGQRFKNGDVVKGLYLDCDITLCEMSDSNGKAILRLMIPDKQNRVPDEAEYPHSMQIFCTQMLYMLENNN